MVVSLLLAVHRMLLGRQEKYRRNNHAHIIAEIDGVLLRYLFHYLQTVNVTPLIQGSIPKLTGGDFRAIRIPLQPLSVQQEVVRILDSFTKLTTWQKQYEHYQDKLLTFNEMEK
jgi:type I restriction enzyme S subunit